MTKNFSDYAAVLIENMLKIFSDKKSNKNISTRISRGRASASADAFEEELAKLIETHTHADGSIKILVDYPISYKLVGAARAKTIYPDITIVRENTILAIIEAKIDLGYLRDDWAKNRIATFNDLKLSNDVSVDRKVYKTPERFSFCCVVLTAKNDHGRLANFLEQPINPIVLISEDHLHPNDDNAVNNQEYFDCVTTCDENQKQWTLLEKFLLRVI